MDVAREGADNLAVTNLILANRWQWPTL